MAALSTHTPPNLATTVLDASVDPSRTIHPVDIAGPDLPDFDTAAAMFAYIGVDEPPQAVMPINRFDTDPSVWAPDQAGQLLARTGETSVTFRAAWHAVLYRVRHNRAALEPLAEEIDNALLWFTDDVDGLPEPPATAEVNYTSKLYRIAVLLCAILTQQARANVYATAWRASALVELIAATVAELWTLIHSDDQHADDETAREDWPDRQLPPPILEALTTSVLTAAPPALNTACVECSAALPMTR
ncbi:hypothetical protein GCM10009691_18760 [Brevibacterium picturae]|uniref:Uncharacterized protein n=2 Tax=Brevibacterium picturae TaxID=260553 RepID=A0ABP4MI47_9MICO